MYTLEITHHNGLINYPNKHGSNRVVQTQVLEDAYISKQRVHMNMLKAYILSRDNTVESIKIIDTKQYKRKKGQ